MEICNNNNDNFLQVKPNKKDAELATLRVANAELNQAMAWGEQKMKNMQEELTKYCHELHKLRKECFEMADQNEILRGKVKGALKQLMGDWDCDDEDDN
jgi:hypothetical protein